MKTNKVLIVGGILVALLAGCGLLTGQLGGNAADIAQSMSVIESAQAAQEAARAAQIASAGLSTVASMQGLILVLQMVLIFGLITAGVYLLIKRGQANLVSLAAPKPAAKAPAQLASGDPLDALLKVYMLRELGRAQGQAPAQLQQPVEWKPVEEDEQIPW